MAFKKKPLALKVP